MTEFNEEDEGSIAKKFFENYYHRIQESIAMTLVTAKNFFLNEVLARIMNNYSEYQTGITEIHHTKKLDSPSGTAITLAEGILNSHAAFESWKLEAGESSGPTLPIEAIREAEVPGTHIVRYNSPIDSIEIKHTAHNRRGFALGAVVAAEWTANKNGIFGMKDMLNFEALIH
jgi:4-hydroxy-tetrahydrodipicolinate reductase